MLQTEFVKNLHSNYERVQLENKPEEQRYQYCILSRGGIKGLLPCNLRYLDGKAYLYYDITSKQNVMQLFQKRNITREWVKDFLWSFRQIQVELDRFLLDERNVLWYPGQVYQDLENNIFSFLYIPYYERDNGFREFLEFLAEHVDYQDEALVECVYKIYEGFEQNGDIYLQKHIFDDAKMLEQEKVVAAVEEFSVLRRENISEKEIMPETDFYADIPLPIEEERESRATQSVPEKKGLFSMFESKLHKKKTSKNDYQKRLTISMENMAVAEEFDYEGEDYGRTVYIETPCEKEKPHRLYTPDGKLVAQLGEEAFTIGKKKGEVDLVLDDFSISRIHARITKEDDDYYLEDMNSTNGTFKNGLRMQPYEKRKLQEEDEIKLGAVLLVFR